MKEFAALPLYALGWLAGQVLWYGWTPDAWGHTYWAVLGATAYAGLLYWRRRVDERRPADRRATENGL